jgi:predicted transcriptional regulator
VAGNELPSSELPSLISTVYASLKNTHEGAPVVESKELVPAVPTKKSVFPDHIVCLEDGKKFKSLKRHLRSSYDMSPDDYRAKWGLPADYPMVAPNYAAARSELAKKIGLGRGRR